MSLLRRAASAAVLACLVVGLGCGGDDASRRREVDIGSDADPDAQTGEVDTTPIDFEVEVRDGGETETGDCPGCFGAPCENNSDCNSGWCVPGPADGSGGDSGKVCTSTCEDACPTAWSCRPVGSPGGDLTYICIYDHSAYCAPCDDESDCVDPIAPTADNRCVAAGEGLGSYCATACRNDGECPIGSACEIVNDDGEESSVCRPVPTEGDPAPQCDCSPWAINRVASTSCSTTNGFGTCAGRRACGDDGLGACDATPAVAESCNRADDDCDGRTDEDFPELGDACDGDDADKCALGTLGCGSNGDVVCQNDRASSPEVCNNRDDDCDGETDEDLPDDGTACDGDDNDLCEDDVVRCIDGSNRCVDAGAPVIEVCNAVDDDCDGFTDQDDEDMVRPFCEGAVGVCATMTAPAHLCNAGVWAGCGTNDFIEGAPGFEPDGEARCDGLDDDCDGEADEDFALVLLDGTTVSGVGKACGTGACAGSVTACNAAGTGIACAGEITVATETCNAIDDDCDGVTDDQLPVTQCERQVGVCQGATKPPATCLNGTFAVCGDAIYGAHAATYQSGKELSCDGLDNDCDGFSDEDFTATLPSGVAVSGIGKACGVGACAGGFTVCDDDGEGASCSSDGNASAEICNGKDDDCDGLTDGADPDLVRPLCEKQGGICAGAMKPAALCVSGTWRACGTADYDAFAPDYEAGAEVKCDGKDEDCDGTVDDDFQMVTLDGESVRGVGTACGSGACAGGTARCAADGTSIECSSAGSVGEEVCDGIDNDCDGDLDAADGSLVRAACNNQVGICAGAKALPERCVSGHWGECVAADFVAHDATYQASAEVACDGRDEDCSGSADEDFSMVTADGTSVTGIGKSCGAGECTGGTTVCAPGGLALACDSSGDAVAEVCDGVDNDCDGLTDNADADLVRITCQNQRGVCDGSKRPADKCVGGVWQACDDDDFGGHAATYEVGRETKCDGADNDCDGNVDEDFTMTDKSGATINGASQSCGVGACAGGVTTCTTAKDGIECLGDGNASAERCNFVDDDCDGAADAADTSLVLDPCVEQRGVCQGATHAREQCSGGQWSTCQVADFVRNDAAFQDGRETHCDGDDNDCDGAIDEDIVGVMADGTEITGVGKPCGGGACEGGQTLCSPSGTRLMCSAESGISTEICDGIDNDCNGETDADDPGMLRTVCDEQKGVCNGARRPPSACVAGTWQACGIDVYAAHDDRFESGAELSCDGVDNDCNDVADEDFGFVQENGTTVSGVGAGCGVGLCAGGTLVCNEAKTGVTCPSEANIAEEVCNGKDDDCDGLTDADDPDLTLVACEFTKGVCVDAKKPVSLCVSGVWQACDAVVYTNHSAAYEHGTEQHCDGADNDCDGLADEDFSVTLRDGRTVSGINTACGTGACAGGATRCDALGTDIECSNESVASDEICNNADDDCDGKVDAADDTLLRIDCEEQRGVCAGAKALPARCVSGDWGECIAADYTARAATYQEGHELACDDLDNDCDGTKDEDFAWTSPAGTSFTIGQTCGSGRCANGSVICQGTTGVTCTTATSAIAETCNNQDEDCNGVTDNGCDDDNDDYCDIALGTSGLPEVCPLGGGDCNDASDTVHPNAAELCNRVNEDCDGQIDEDFVNCAKGSCDGSGNAYAAIAVDTCVAGTCTSPAAVSCGLYTCDGGGAAGEVCATSCTTDAQCVSSAHCDETDNRCKPDRDDGGACVEHSDCTGAHCQNGFCCDSGDCCQVPANCSADYTTAASCGTTTTCQGTRQDRACVDNMCAKTAPIADDSACTASVQAITCPAGYPARFCAGGADQSAPVCPSTCSSDAQCSAGYHCDGTCVPNVPDGGSCDEASDCSGGRCDGDHCCATGDCCATALDCADGTFTEVPVCDSAVLTNECDGHRIDKVCNAQFQCAKTPQVDDDSACSGRVANDCGPYKPVMCTAATNQPSAPACPTACASDADCDANAHCDGVCVLDVPDGTACDEASDCTGGRCNNNFCCASGDCCAVASDCPDTYASAPVCGSPASCQGTKGVAVCSAQKICGTQAGVADDSACSAGTLSDSCDLYPSVFCDGQVTQTDPACANTCNSNDQCDPGAYCDNGSPRRCVADQPDGGSCSADAQCQSGHCQNNFCCSGGDCCARTSDCSVNDYTNPSECTDPTNCQGVRFDPVCNAQKICQTSTTPTPDDSGCVGIEANACASFPALVCTGAISQTNPQVCPTTCNTEAQCDAGAFCDLNDHTCKPDPTAGQQCDPEPCATGLTCVDGVCCTTPCTGDCKRCDLPGLEGTCSNEVDGQDPAGDCDGVSCVGSPSYYFGFAGDTCYAKAAIDDADAACGANGTCDTRAELCTGQPLKGAAIVTCDDTCQDPVPGTCSGTTNGQCVNVDAGNITCGKGICERTVPRCVNGGDNVCTPGPQGVEICDGLDNDCDGLTDGADNDLVIPDCAKQDGVCFHSKPSVDRCLGVSGWAQCITADYAATPGTGQYYNANVETMCDARDNDCDGSKDEDFTWTGPNAQVYVGTNTQCGVGACADAATFTVCNAQGTGTVCQYAAGHAPSSEVCSVVGGAPQDDDCDGKLDAADDSLQLKACQEQAGVCSQSFNSADDCVAGVWRQCGADDYQRNATERFGSSYKTHPEIACDTFDNDCNGQVDEDFSVVGANGTTYFGVDTTCGVGRCSDAKTQCNVAGNGTICDYVPGHEPTAEVCSLVSGTPQDDDCDGLLDANDTSLTLLACEKSVGVCASSMKERTDCVNGVWQACDAADYNRTAPTGTHYTSNTEAIVSDTTCDGFDNDCDGDIDEDFSWVGPNGQTYTGLAQLCGVGRCSDNATRTACSADKKSLQCNYAAGHAPLDNELCNLVGGLTVDDDCDGTLDANDTGDNFLVNNPCSNQTGVCNGSLNDKDDCVGGQWRTCDYSDYDRRAVQQGTRYSYTGSGTTWVAKEGTGSGTQLTTCDGLDNDCDGPVDEDFVMTGLSGATYSGINTLCGVGNCSDNATRTACNGANTGIECVYASGHAPIAEDCGGGDQDCDGVDTVADIADVNLDFCAESGRTGSPCANKRVTRDLCNNATGVWGVCGATQYGTDWEASETKCDNIDNDCDGVTETNETAALTQPNCELTVGVCAGKKKPNALCVGGTWGSCSGTTHYGSDWESEETRCDAKDNDCDAFTDGVDVDPNRPLNSNQVGSCASTKQKCNGASGFQDDYSTLPDYPNGDKPDESGVDSNCDGIDGSISVAWFVSATGTGTACTMVSPCALSTALGKVVPGKDHVYLRAGAYGITDITTSAKVYGGFINSAWNRGSRTVSTYQSMFTGGQYNATEHLTIRVAATNVVLDNLWVKGPAATTRVGSNGRSSYAIYAANATLTVSNSNVDGGTGMSGLGGSPGSSASGSAAPGGGRGGDGDWFSSCSTWRPAGGTAGSLSCEGFNASGGDGGRGGSTDSSGGPFCTGSSGNATAGETGSNAAYVNGNYGLGRSGGAGGGTGGGGTAGNSGWPGTPGTGGTKGSNGGTIIGGFWYGNGGGNGTLGGHGGGGGGGGGSGGSDDGSPDDSGAGGGGGGAGGCRAPAFGTGGGAGGGSFGVFGYNSTISVTNVIFTRGKAGAGAAGGGGGVGQTGGGGGASGAGDARTLGGIGGTGGTGGSSGAGGGGAGGMSYCIYLSGGSMTQSGVTYPTTTGDGGGGGSGGTGGVGGGTGDTGGQGNWFP